MSGPLRSSSISLGGDHPTLGSLDDPSASMSRAAPIAELGRGTALGRYTVLEPVGRGGMGTVYAAYDPQLDRKIALKVLRPRAGRPPRPRDRARLLREAQAMARLAHPNVIAVHDVAELEGEVFIAMEFVEGGTLKDWLAKSPRRWDEIRDVFVQAGAGLAAAHAAGLVHRDFKPDNVLIDRSARARVTDFGLARADTSSLSMGGDDDDDDSPAASASNALLDPLTQVGALIGTPAFMAPEQHARLGAEPRTDQFSFCVALYQALFGQHPFSGTTVAEIAAAVTMGQVKEPARDTDVPAPIRRAVLRGLQRQPDDRWPTMDHLLDALRFDPRRRRRRWALAASGVLIAVVAGGSVYAAVHGRGESQPSGCAGSSTVIDGVWHDARRDEIAAAFVATGRPRAEAAFQRTAAMIDAYVQGWRDESRSACEATRIRGVQSDELLDLRTACLQRRADELDATLGVLAQPDRRIVADGTVIAGKLVPISTCSDGAALRGIKVLPDDPALHAAASAALRELADIKANEIAGRSAKVLDAAELLLVRTREIGHLPLVAETELLLAKLHVHLGNAAPAHELLDRAALDAAAAGADHVIAQTHLERLGLLTLVEARFEDALLFTTAAETAITRAGRSDSALVQFLNARATAYLQIGRYAEARRDYEEALALTERGEKDVVQRATVLNNLGALDFTTGDHAGARVRFEQALAIRRRLQGNLHPDIAECLYNIGNTHLEVGEVEEAIGPYREALAIVEATGEVPPSSEAGLHNALGVAYLSQGRLAQARHEAELSREIAAQLGPDSLARIAPQVLVAQLDASEGHRDRGLAAMRKLEAELRIHLGPQHPFLGTVLGQIGRFELADGDLETAREHLATAIALIEQVGQDHVTLVPMLVDFGQLTIRQGDRARGREHLERAVKLAAKGTSDHWETANARFQLAKVIVGEDRSRALELARAASRLLQGVGAREYPNRDDVDQWIASVTG